MFQRAISLDPNFAMAYARLGSVYGAQQQSLPEAENLRKAYDLRDRVSQRERFYIESRYYHLVLGDKLAARKVYKRWMDTYPQDPSPINALGAIYGTLGEHDKALTAFQKAVQREPTNALAYCNLVLAYLEVNRLDEAQAAAREAQAHNLDPPLLHLNLYLVDFLQHDSAAMEREAARLLATPGWEDRMLSVEAGTAAYYGQMIKSRELTQRAMDSALHGGSKATAATYQAMAAIGEALYGNTKLARKQAQVALALSTDDDTELVSAFALALAGDSVPATRLMDNVVQHLPTDTNTLFNYLPAFHAAVALNSGNPAKAIEALVSRRALRTGRRRIHSALRRLPARQCLSCSA